MGGLEDAAEGTSGGVSDELEWVVIFNFLGLLSACETFLLREIAGSFTNSQLLPRDRHFEHGYSKSH